MNMLTKSQLRDVCLATVSDHRQCRYLGQDDMDPTVFVCLKLSARRAEIDEQVEEDLRKMKQKGINPTSQQMPLGDNCEGYPVLRYVKQGYDAEKA